MGEERGAPFRFQPGPKTIQSPSLMSVDSRMLVQWRGGKFSHGAVMSLGGWGWLVSFSRKQNIRNLDQAEELEGESRGRRSRRRSRRRQSLWEDDQPGK